jgi:hypothetical protein
MKTCLAQISGLPQLILDTTIIVFYLIYFAMPLMLVHTNMSFMQVMLPEAVAIVAAPTDPTR